MGGAAAAHGGGTVENQWYSRLCMEVGGMTVCRHKVYKGGGALGLANGEGCGATIGLRPEAAEVEDLL